MPLQREDFSAFSKIIAAALLVCGFIFMGLLVGRQVAGKGGPEWAVAAGATVGAVVGNDPAPLEGKGALTSPRSMFHVKQ